MSLKTKLALIVGSFVVTLAAGYLYELANEMMGNRETVYEGKPS